jgi:amino acid adenylation domain-containing protein/thioester reductase-like protein
MSDLDEQLNRLSPERRALLQRRLRQKRSGREDTRIGRRPDPHELVLSIAQERLWFLQQLHPDSAQYNRRIAYVIEGELRPDDLRDAYHHLTARHSTLRASIETVNGAPVPAVCDADSLTLAIVDGDEEDTGPGPWTRERARHLCAEPFRLAGEPLVRATLFRLSPRRHLLVIVMHHAVSDGWSDGILVGELIEAYQAVRDAARTPPAPPRIDYFDFAYWQRGHIASGGAEAHQAYWADQLRDAAPLDLVPDRRTDLVRHQSGRCDFSLPADLRRGLEELAREHGATLFMALTAGFATMLHRRSRQEDIVVGTTSAGRTRPELEGVIGYFVNTLPLRFEVTAQSTFTEILERTRTSAIGAFAHQELPFAHIVEAAHPDRRADIAPIVQATCTLQNAPSAVNRLAGLSFRPYDVPVAVSPFGLSLSFATQESSLRGRIEFDAGTFEQGTIQDCVGWLRQLLSEAVQHPRQRIGALPLVPAAVREELRKSWRSERPPRRPWLGGVHRGLLARLRAAGHRVVLRSGTQHWTGFDLLSRAHGVSAALRRAGVGVESRVGLAVRRGPDLVVAMVAALTTGGTYVPLDPDAPADRLAATARQAGLVAVVTEEPLPWLPEGVATVSAAHSGESDEAGTPVAPDNAAYVVFTSGSTGQPKGVVVTHGALQNLLTSMLHEPGLDNTDRLVAVTPVTFDIAVFELLGSLLAGAQLVIATAEQARDPGLLRVLLADSDATVLQATPATWRMLLEAGWRPAGEFRALVGGEALPTDLADGLRERASQVWNCYGPTETTVWSAILPVRGGPVRIGGAVNETDLMVVDDEFQPVGHKIPGELLIGGAGLARGYAGRPDLTAERFVPHPARTGQRAYRTGDLVRSEPDGTLEFLGRIDQQLKIRGYRIEPGEVEAVLRAHPGIAEAVVDAVGQSTRRRLVAWLVPRDARECDLAEIRLHVRRTLPAYLRPESYVVVDQLPLTSSGKINRRALPGPAEPGESTREGAPPATPSETTLAEVWNRVLGPEEIGRDDDFFALGGNSMLAASMTRLVSQRLGRQIPLLLLFANPTLRGFAAAVDGDTLDGNTVDAGGDLDGDSRLPEDFAAPDAPALVPARAVLLTGATGFLGVNLLEQLLTQTSATVYCLVRAPNREAANARVRRALRDARLWREEFAHRLVAVPGSLDQPGLGLGPEVHERLVSVVDAIYHNGAVVNFLATYAQLRAPNVWGTGELLRLAAGKRAVPVHFVSTVGVLAPGSLTEEPAPETADHLDRGYERTKWVAERLVTAACARGLPAVVYRPGRIGGHTVTGTGPRDDLVWQLVRLCAELGAEPDVEIPFFVAPVDYVARALIRLSLRGVSSGVYHLTGRHAVSSGRILARLREAGYPMRRLKVSEWIELARTRSSGDALLHALGVTGPDWLAALSWWPARTPFDDQRARDELRRAGIVQPEIDDDMIDRWIQYYIETRYLPARIPATRQT